MRIAIAAAVLALAAWNPPGRRRKPPHRLRRRSLRTHPASSFMPAPVGPPRTYEAMSKTAMSFTPGVLILTPTQQKSENLPAGMVFAFGNGDHLRDDGQCPAGRCRADKPFDWANRDDRSRGRRPIASKIEMFSVDKETVPPERPMAGFCSEDVIPRDLHRPQPRRGGHDHRRLPGRPVAAE